MAFVPVNSKGAIQQPGRISKQKPHHLADFGKSYNTCTSIMRFPRGYLLLAFQLVWIRLCHSSLSNAFPLLWPDLRFTASLLLQAHSTQRFTTTACAQIFNGRYCQQSDETVCQEICKKVACVEKWALSYVHVCTKNSLWKSNPTGILVHVFSSAGLRCCKS